MVGVTCIDRVIDEVRRRAGIERELASKVDEWRWFERRETMDEYHMVRMVLLLLLFKKVGNARLGVGDQHPISPKTTAPQYQPIELRKRKGKQLVRKSQPAARQIKMHLQCS